MAITRAVSCARRSSTWHLGNLLEELRDERLGRHPLERRFVRQNQSVIQRRDEELTDFVEPHVGLSTDERQRSGALRNRERSARGGAVSDEALHRVRSQGRRRIS